MIYFRATPTMYFIVFDMYKQKQVCPISTILTSFQINFPAKIKVQSNNPCLAEKRQFGIPLKNQPLSDDIEVFSDTNQLKIHGLGYTYFRVFSVYSQVNMLETSGKLIVSHMTGIRQDRSILTSLILLKSISIQFCFKKIV